MAKFKPAKRPEKIKHRNIVNIFKEYLIIPKIKMASIPIYNIKDIKLIFILINSIETLAKKLKIHNTNRNSSNR